MRSRIPLLAVNIPIALLVGAATLFGGRQDGTHVHPSPPGIVRFTPVSSTVACSGAVTPEAVEGLKRSGFASIVNLRTAEEEGANLAAMRRAAEAAGLRYFHVPLSSSSPEFEAVDRFLEVAREKRNEPMLINCASGGRAAMLLAIERVMVDGWSVERAMSEVPSLSDGMRPSVREFGMEYLKKKGAM